MKRGTKMGWIVAALVGVAVLVVWVIYINRSWTEEEVERAMNQFEDVWIGKQCKKCKRRDFCTDPIV